MNYKSLVDEKLIDLKKEIADMKVNGSISKNTRGTQLYKLGRERRVLHLIGSLLTEDVKLSDEDNDTLLLITTLASERVVRQAIEVNEGDVIMDLLQKYSDRKNVYEKIRKACDEKGLVMDFASGKITK